eukprot:CAMPEP_0183777812 /NCGR_PEP_ID=MMETSP0739-20130205/49941_1 /TAXON_ID=385413 /ORGANISM="Thalassiosira miniscula, Strain CCMP1093" /LENGTH=73 /DNA_ID=CAMNT_0026020035 /DNA_START=83 /DNA_END=304 /DNA_ORIENTATION=-
MSDASIRGASALVRRKRPRRGLLQVVRSLSSEEHLALASVPPPPKSGGERETLAITAEDGDGDPTDVMLGGIF